MNRGTHPPGTGGFDRLSVSVEDGTHPAALARVALLAILGGGELRHRRPRLWHAVASSSMRRPCVCPGRSLLGDGLLVVVVHADARPARLVDVAEQILEPRLLGVEGLAAADAAELD